MARLFLLLGVLMMGGALFVVNDTAKMAANDPEFVFDLQEYAGDMPARIERLMSEDVGPALANLPQTARNMVDNWQNPPEEQVESTDRLAGVKERNTVIAREGITPDTLSKMSPYEIYQNRDKIVKGLTTSIQKKMEGIF